MELPEWHKLDDVSHGRLSSLRTQASIVSIQELHGSEVRPPYPDYDDRHWQTRGVDDGVAGLVHVCDHSVSDDEQNVVLLQEENNNTGRKSKEERRGDKRRDSVDE